MVYSNLLTALGLNALGSCVRGNDLAVCHPRESGDPGLQRIKSKTLGKIFPLRIACFDQFQLPGAPPFLDSLLAGDRRFHAFMMFQPYKTFDTVLLGKAIEGSGAMLCDA